MENCGCGQEENWDTTKLVLVDDWQVKDRLAKVDVDFVLCGLHHIQVGVGDERDGGQIRQAGE